MKKADEIASNHEIIQAQIDTPVSKLVGSMIGKNSNEVLIFSGKKYEGILSHFSILKSRNDVSQDKAANHLLRTATLEQGSELPAIAKQMLNPDIYALPVLESDTLTKIIHVRDIMESLAEDASFGWQVGEVAEDPITIPEDATIGKALELMHDKKTRYLLVIDKINNPSGLLMARRILKQYRLHHTQERQYGEKPNTPLPTTQTEKKDLSSLPITNFISRVILVGEETEPKQVINLLTSSDALVIRLNGMLRMITSKSVLKRTLQSWELKTQNSIEYKGFNVLDKKKADYIKDVVEGYAEKMPYYFNNIFQLTLHAKEREKSGKRSRFEVHSRVSYPGDNITAEADDWEPITAVRKAMDKIKEQLKSKYKDKRIEQPEYDYQAAVRRDIKIEGGEG